MAKNKNKNSTTGYNVFLIAQLAVMLVLSLIISIAISSRTHKTANENMKTLALERGQIIKNYVEHAESILSAYSHAGQITNVLQNKDENISVQEAQNYSESFKKDFDNLEGIYVSEWSTRVIAHSAGSDTPIIGNYTRNDSGSREQLQNALTAAGDSVYDAGIIISPATNKQIISMYKGIFEEGTNRKLGIVGLGFYTENLIKTLDDITQEGKENFKYSMFNVADSKYVFSNEKDIFVTEEKINDDGTVRVVKDTISADNDKIIDLCNEFSKNPNSKEKFGKFESKLTDGEYVSTYYYMNERYMNEKGWIFVISQPKKDYYSLSNTLVVYMAVFVIFCVLIAIVSYFINQKKKETDRMLSTAVKKNVRTKESLNTALFNDILTDANNRVSFSTDFGDGKVKDAPDYPYYFAMFNIVGFSDFNINYGNETGDMLLVNTARSLKSSFAEGTVYRTGSDEFVVVVRAKNTQSGFEGIQTSMKNALSRLASPLQTDSGSLAASYRTALVKKSRNVNAGVLSTLKDLTNRNGVTQPGQLVFVDLDKS